MVYLLLGQNIRSTYGGRDMLPSCNWYVIKLKINDPFIPMISTLDPTILVFGGVIKFSYDVSYGITTRVLGVK